MKRFFLIILLFGLFFQNIYAQQPFCDDADPFCTDSIYNYPLATGTTSEAGPDYGCLLTQPNPVWYFLQISVAGDINIHMESTPGSYDIDFICWGPFTTATGACTAGLTAGNTVDCSYSTASVEDCYIPNAQVGEFYMFLLTNYSNSTTDVEFSSGTSTGETDCSIVVPCTMTNITVNVGPCDPVTNTYDITGTIVYINPPATGSLIIEDDAGPGFFDSFIPTPNFFSPTNFSITGIPADGLTHTLYSYFTDDGCNYTITYTAPAPCMGCVTPPGSITATTPDCYDSPITFTYVPGTVDPGATYLWNFGTGATPATANTVGSHTVTYSTPGSTPNITLTVTDPTCAPNVINISVTIPTEITVSSSSSTPEVCGAFDGTISVTATGGTGALSYDIGSGGQATGNFTSLLAGPYTITITDVNGCTITELVTVGTSGTVTSGFTASADQCLTGNSFNFTNTGDTGGGITWTWSFSGGTPSSSANENPTGVTWTIPGQYDVTQTTHLGGCNTTTTITIEVFAEPIPTLSSTNVTCNGACDGTASVDLVYPGGNIWNNGAVSQSISNLCVGQYCVTVIDNNGCTGNVCVTISEAAGITINSETASDVTCFGDNDGAVVVSATGGTPPLTYTDGTSSNQTGSFPGLGGGTYIVTITDGNGCTTTSSALIVVEPADIIIDSQSSTDVSCYGYNDGGITIAASGGAGGLTYSIDGNQQSVGDFTNLPPSIYTVTVTDVNGCTNTAGFTITTPPEILISITPDQLVCNGQTATINAAIVGGNQPYTYNWSHASINSPVIYVTLTTETVYSVYVVDANGCVSSTVTSTVSVSPPVQLELNTQNEYVCPGDPALITISPSAGIGPPYLTYVDGNVQDSPFTVYPSLATTYVVAAMDACGSIATESITIYVHELPPISFAPNITNGCQPLEVQFNETSPNDGQTFVWNFGDIDNNNLAYDKSPVHTYDDPGIYDVTLTVTSVDGCVNTDTKLNLITVYPQPIAKFIADPEVVSIIKPMINFINHSSLNDINFWFFGDGDSSSAENPCHIYPTYPTGTYNVELIVSTIHGCKDTTFIIVQVQNEYTFYAPTAFSPDFDGINDRFVVKGNGIDKRNFHMLIYDRWGEVIFETNDIYEGWDGRVNGGDIGKNGTYTWLVIYKDLRSVEHQEAGAVTIIR